MKAFLPIMNLQEVRLASLFSKEEFIEPIQLDLEPSHGIALAADHQFGVWIHSPVNESGTGLAGDPFLKVSMGPPAIGQDR